MPLNGGIYIITNVKQRNVVFLESLDDYTPLQGHYRRNNLSEQWHVIDRGNGQYSIQNVGLEHYAYWAPRAGLDAFVEGHSRERLWYIKECSPLGVNFTIATTDTGNFWMLPDNQIHTPVGLLDKHADRRCWWTFTNPDTEIPANQDKEDESMLFEMKPLPILPFSPLKLDFIIIQEKSDDSISNASATIGGLCDPLVSLRRPPHDALSATIIEFKCPSSNKIFFHRFSDPLTFERLRDLEHRDISWKRCGGQALPQMAMRGLRADATKVAILSLKFTLIQQSDQAIIMLINDLIQQDTTLILTPIEPTWADTFYESSIFQELEKLSFEFRLFEQKDEFSDYIVNYNETVALPRLAQDRELRDSIHPNIPYIVEVLKDKNDDTRLAAVAALSQLAAHVDLQSVMFQTVHKITEMLKGDSGEAEAAALTLIQLSEQAELRDAISQAVFKTIEMLKCDDGETASSILIQLAERAELRYAICQNIPHIIVLLKDHNHHTRSAAVTILSQLAELVELQDTISRAAFRMIEMLICDDGEIACSILIQLAAGVELRDLVHLAIPKVMEVLNDKKIGARSTAAAALSKLAEQAELRDVIRSHIPLIIEMLKNKNDDTRSAAAAALSQLAAHAELRGVIFEAVHQIMEMLKGNTGEVKAGASAFIQLAGHVEWHSSICQNIPHIINLLKDENHHTRSAAVTILSQLAGCVQFHDAIYHAMFRILEMLKCDDGTIASSMLIQLAAHADFRDLLFLFLGAIAEMLKGHGSQAEAAASALIKLAEHAELHDLVLQAVLELIETPRAGPAGAEIWLDSDLAWAAESGYEPLIRFLLAQKGVYIDAEDQEGWTPLSWAAVNGYDAVLRLLLEYDGLDVNSRISHDDQRESYRGYAGATPLYIAAKKGYDMVVRLLLAQESVDVNAMDTYNNTPLTAAAENGHDAVVRLLLAQESVDVNYKNVSGVTPLHSAARYGHVVVLRLLLAREGVDVNCKQVDGATPLHIAAEKGPDAVLQLLLAQDSVDINSKNKRGWTPLHVAAEKGHDAGVQLLLAHESVDVNSKHRFATPLHFAAQNGHIAVVRLLLAQEGVDVNAKNWDGHTPLKLAKEGKHETVVRLLREKIQQMDNTATEETAKDSRLVRWFRLPKASTSGNAS